MPGDDIKHLDWKVFAKSDRFYIKEYEEETNLRSYLLLDASESMRYGSGEDTKYDAACAAVAALTYLLIRQQDQVGFALFDSDVRTSIPPSANPQTLRAVLETMVTSEAREKTDLSRIFGDLAAQWTRRGIVVIASDLFDEIEHIEKGIRLLRAVGHEVVILHVLDAAERTFPFEGNTLFKGLEQMPELMVDPRALRDGYLRSLERFQHGLQEACATTGADLVSLTVGEPIGGALAAYLARRSAGLGSGRR